MASIEGGADGRPVLWGEGRAAVVSADGVDLVLEPFDERDLVAHGRVTFDTPVVAFEALGSAEDVVVAVQLCATSAAEQGDQHSLCVGPSTYELLVLRPDGPELVSLEVPFEGEGDLAGLSISDRWIGLQVGSDFLVADRIEEPSPRTFSSQGLGPCVAGGFVVSRDPAAAQVSSTTVADTAPPQGGHLLVQSASDPANTATVELPVQPSAVACGPDGVVITGGTGNGSRVLTFTTTRQIGELVEMGDVAGTATQAQRNLGHDQVALVTTFSDGVQRASFISPTDGVVRPGADTADVVGDTASDVVLGGSFYWRNGTLFGIMPTQTGWEYAEVKP